MSNNVYINRQEIVDYIKQNGFVYATTLETWPAADVREVVRGEWEWFDEEHGNPIDGYDRDWGWRCSACKGVLDDEYDDPDCPPQHNFCPNCGAYMRGNHQ